MIPFLDFLKPVVEKALSFVPDPKQKAEMQFKIMEEMNKHEDEILKAITSVDVAQANINAVDAASSDKFKSYPRPLAMWVCVTGLVWEVLTVVVAQVFVWTGHTAPQILHLPEYVTGMLLTGLLGLGGYRYLEKKDGLTK